MATISPSYASPGLRWGLCLEDHPEAYAEPGVATAAELGIPEIFSPPEDLYCTMTIIFPAESKKPSIVGWKHIPTGQFLKAPSTPKGEEEHLSDLWNILCTKALGRALKRAGYPDDIPDLKALTVWRMRTAQMEALQLGNVQFTMGLADAERAIDDAGKVDQAPSGDDGGGVDTETQRALPSGEPPSEESMLELRDLINQLGPQFSRLQNWCKSLGMSASRPATEDQAAAIIAKARGIIAGTDTDDEIDGDTPTPIEGVEVAAAGATEPVDPFASTESPSAVTDPQTIETIRVQLEAIMGDATTKKSWQAYARSIKVDWKADPETWTPENRAEVLAWLEVG